MYMERISFDAVIKDKDGRTIEADCYLKEPSTNGLAAEISIEIPLKGNKIENFKNPCSLIGSEGGFEIEIKNLHYRSITFDTTQRKHARAILKISYAEYLRIKTNFHRSERKIIKFLISSARFLKNNNRSRNINYSSTPNMNIELFNIKTLELGNIKFIKFWHFHRTDANGVEAEIHTNFAAEIQYNNIDKIDYLVEKMREVLDCLSILTRQAITLHGWIWEKTDGIETMWLNPITPNTTPDMTEEPPIDLCFPQEFQTCAQTLVQKFLQADLDKKNAVKLLSNALAPHVIRSTEANFLALFGALEEVIALEKLTRQEKEKLRETDQDLINALLEKKQQLETSENPNSIAVAKRLEGYAQSVRNSGPSFNVRFEKFKSTYQNLPEYMDDLWPIQGSEKMPGLKNLRDSLAHGLKKKYSHQTIAVAQWHFARLAERLVFLVLGIDVPKGISPQSSLLQKDPWYAHTKWYSLRSSPN